nr:MAG TPA: hypothetical protein [Caudoviricetes sp.]
MLVKSPKGVSRRMLKIPGNEVNISSIGRATDS